MYTYCTTLPLRDALPLGSRRRRPRQPVRPRPAPPVRGLSSAAASPLLQRDAEDHRGRAILDRTRRAEAPVDIVVRSEEHTSELQSLMRISYAVFCLKKKYTTQHATYNHETT